MGQLMEAAEQTVASYRALCARAEIALLHARTVEEALSRAGLDVYGSLDADSITLFVGDHEEAMKCCGALGQLVGHRWDRKPSYFDEGTLTYSAKIAADNFSLLISGVTPPKNCQTYEVVVPEKREKKVRIVCHE